MLVWMLACLAGSGAFAATMPICKQVTGHHGHHITTSTHDYLSHQINDRHTQFTAEISGDHSSNSPSGISCNSCDLCHSAVVVLLPDVGVPLLWVNGVDYQAFPIAAFVSRFPDKPLRIPLSRFA